LCPTHPLRVEGKDITTIHKDEICLVGGVINPNAHNEQSDDYEKREKYASHVGSLTGRKRGFGCFLWRASTK
jgi:hypothetical protein